MADVPLLERAAPLAVLHSYADEARTGDGRLVLVCGEAGAGKSSLLAALEGECPDARWYWGRCDGQFTPRALGPLLDVSAQFGGELAALVAGAAPREHLFAALLEQLRAATVPTVLVVEDAHWADEATLDLLRFLARRLRGLLALVLVTYRDDALGRTDPLQVALGDLSSQRGTRRLLLPPLSLAAVAALARGSGLDAGELHRLTGGNPFFVTEVLTTGSTSVPASVRDAVLARAATVSAVARETLALAALGGTQVDPGVLGAAPEVFDELVEAGLLSASADGLTFRHELVRLAVDTAVPPHRRVPAHRLLLSALVAAGTSDAARLAYHAEGAGDRGAAARYARMAAEEAKTLGAYRAAVDQYQRALRVTPAEDMRAVAELNDALAEQLTYVDRWSEAALAQQQAIVLWGRLGDRRREGASHRALSTVMWRLCRGAESVAALAHSIDLLEPLGVSAELARSYSKYAFHLWISDPDVAETMLQRALAMAAELGMADVSSDVLDTAAYAIRARGDDWVPQMEQALALALAADATAQAGRAYANMYSLLADDYRFAEAERYWRDGIAYCDDRHIPTFATCLRGHRAGVLLHLGRWDEAAAMAQHVLATDASPVNLITSQVALGLVRARRGDSDPDRLLDAAVAAADTLAEGDWIALTRRARAEARWLAGNIAAARDDVRYARTHLTTLDRSEDAEITVWEQRLGGTALDDATGVAQQWDARSCPYHAALALADSAEPALVRAALARFEALGARAASALVRRRLRQLGVRSVPVGARAATRADMLGLTRREREVLELVRIGCSNDEIAQRLVISRRTVDHHVSALLAKLGVHSRKDAVRKLGIVG